MEDNHPDNEADVADEQPGSVAAPIKAQTEWIFLGKEEKILINPLLGIDEVEGCNRGQLCVHHDCIGRELELLKHGGVDAELLAVDEAPQLAERSCKEQAHKEV